MKKLLKLGLILAGTATLSLTMANAKCGDNPPDKTRAPLMKCQSGKCNAGKCGKAGMKQKETNTTKPSAEKTAPAKAKGKCGVGKCS